MRLESAALLWDAHAAAGRAKNFVADLDEGGYRADELRKSAVERQFEILGEALSTLRRSDPDTAERIPDVHRIIGLRNILAHGYAVVDDAIVWDAAVNRVPGLLVAVAQLLSELD